MADLFKILLAEKLGHCDSLYESVIGKKLGGYSWLSDYETTPYLYRAMPNLSHYYNREIMEEVVGGSVGWNQLCNGSSVTVQSGHKYFLKKGGAESVATSAGSAITGLASGSDIVVDLTLALGSTIADYVYSLEQATAGSGVAWLKEHFPKMCQYNPYDAGSIQSVSGLVSHDTVGFNQWDEEWEVGMYQSNSDTVEKISDTTHIRSKNPIEVKPNSTYYMNSASKSVHLIVADAEGNVLYRTTSLNNGIFTTPTNGAFVYFNMTQAYGTTYNHDICINLSDASKNGTYEPYRKSSYPLDSTLTLRGIPKLDNGNLYYDGDVYEADGTVTRKYGIVDLGTLDWTYNGSGSNVYFRTESIDDIKPTALRKGAEIVCSKYVYIGNAQTADISDKQIAQSVNNSSRVLFVKDSAYNDASAFKTAMSGVYLVYELATPTTETAQPFTKTQKCDSGGTEEWTLVGKNLFDVSNTTHSGYNIGSIPNVLKPNTQYTYSINGTTDYKYSLYLAKSETPLNAEASLGTGYIGKGDYVTITTPSDMTGFDMLCLAGGANGAGNENISAVLPQIELGSSATPYEPYGFNIVSVGHKSKYAEK